MAGYLRIEADHCVDSVAWGRQHALVRWLGVGPQAILRTTKASAASAERDGCAGRHPKRPRPALKRNADRVSVTI
jgi:hypothetical protein